MLRNLRKLSILSKIAKKQKTDDIVDVILFGSAARGKEEPRDFDICVVFRDKIDFKKIRDIEKEYERHKMVIHLSFLTADNFFTKPHSLAKTLLLEGKSLFTSKKVSSNYGLAGKTIFLYKLKDMKPSEKVKFIHALKGRRKNEGILSTIKDKLLAPSFIMIPTSEEHKIVSILDYWNVSYKRIKLLL